MPRKGSNKCPKGQILRKGYRKSSGTYVAPNCVKDMGKPGKGPKTLPPIGEPGLLRKYGYSTSLGRDERARKLKLASKIEGPLKILRHLNLIRNYQADEKVKGKMSRDVEYLSQLYSRKKSKSSRRKSSRKRSKKRSKKRSRKGSKKHSRKGSKKSSKKRSRKGSKKHSRKGSKKSSKKRSKKGSKKRSKRSRRSKK